MEILIIIVFIIFIKFYKPKSSQKILIVDLPIGRNKDNYFDDTAFTEVYQSLRG